MLTRNENHHDTVEWILVSFLYLDQPFISHGYAKHCCLVSYLCHVGNGFHIFALWWYLCLIGVSNLAPHYQWYINFILLNDDITFECLNTSYYCHCWMSAAGWRKKTWYLFRLGLLVERNAALSVTKCRQISGEVFRQRLKFTSKLKWSVRIDHRTAC